MGDRCFVQLTLRREDLQKFRDLTEWGDCFTVDDESGDSTAVDGYIEEVNYWGEDELSKAAKGGVMFHGTNESGCGYGRGEFLSDGKHLRAINVDEEGYACVRYDTDTGAPLREAQDKSTIKRFSVRLRRVKRFVNGKGEACPN